MRFSRDDVETVMDDLVSIRLKLDRWGRQMAEAAGGRLGPRQALIVSAEANVYRSLVQLKEVYRHWLDVVQACDVDERAIAIDESPFLVRERMTS